jgi:hypothetical protein
MGRAIFYCYRCSVRLSEEALEKGKAFKAGDRVVCLACAPGAGVSPTPKPMRAGPSTTAMRRGPASARIAAPEAPEEEADVPPPPSKRKLLLLVGSGAGVLAVVVLVLVLSLGGKAPPAPSAPPAPPPVAEEPKKKPPVPAAPGADLAALEAVRQWAAAHPADLGGHMSRLQELRFKHESSEAVKTDIEALRRRIDDTVHDELAKLEASIAGPLARKDFGEALRILEQAEKRLALPEWTLAVGKRQRGLREERDRTAETAKEPEPPPKEPEKPKGPAIPVETAPRSEEGKAYLARCERAAPFLAVRDFDQARAELSRGGSPKEDGVRRELEQDLEDVKLLEAFFRDGVQSVLKSAKAALSVETVDRGRVSGRVLRIDAHRVELGGDARKPSTFVEWTDVKAGWLARAGAETRIVAAAMLLEGDLEGAKSLLGGKLDAVAPKLWAWAPVAKERRPKIPGPEASARELFHAAEQLYRSASTRGQAIEKYRALRSDFGGTRVAASALERIVRRSEAGRDQFFAAADFEISGTFQKTADGRLVSKADTEEDFAHLNYAEFEFVVLPGQTYRAWVQVGVCCEVTYSAWWQGTELSEYDSKRKKQVSCEPGGRAAALVKAPIRNLKPAHDKAQPKAPTRWEWIELPLPKYAGPGPKRIRLMTDQQGFGIGMAAVSCVRKTPPPPDDVAALRKSAEADREVLPLDPDLLGWWSFDDSGADLSGGGRDLEVSGGEWTAGKVGGALKFGTQTGKAAVDDRPELRVTASFTVAFWVRKDAESADWSRIVGKGQDTDRTFGVWEFPKEDKRLKFQQAGSGKWFDIDGTKTLEIGVWTHVAAGIDGNRGFLFVDGVKDGEKVRDFVPAAPAQPLTVGAGGPHGGFVGAIDDLRLYGRALAEEEIRALYEAGR